MADGGTTDSARAAPRKPAPALPLRVALVGCGAVARANLLPVLAGHDRIHLVALVDRDEARARELSDMYQVGQVLTDLAALTAKDVDAVILATPPAHHAPATIALAEKGLHVFVEKPMATNHADAEAMVSAAERARVTLGVGLYRRFLPSVRLLRQLVEQGEFGAPLAIDIEEGGAYGWELATLDVLTRAAGGGGVLMDIGSHLIDELLYTIPGHFEVRSFEDNARGGIETDCLLHADLTTDYGTLPVKVELSRTRDLENSIRVECEHATLELRRADFTSVRVLRTTDNGAPHRERAPISVTATWADAGEFVGYQAFRDQIDDWLSAISSGEEPVLSGRSVVPVTRVIQDCYERRTAIVEPWTDEGFATRSSPRTSASRPEKPRRVLVTGAGGFLGGRTVELLRERFGWDAVALVKSPRSAARLARWPGEIVLGDVCSADDMARAVRGCDAVVHCAVGTTWPPEAARKVTVDGTRVVAEAALAAGVKRFVHISTLFVHRRDDAGQIDESRPLDPAADDDYGQAKLAAERALDAVAAKGLSTVVLRPTRIYGPFSKTFTVRPLGAMSKGQFAIAGDATVPANMVYVDNVVEAIARAVEAPGTVSGSAYLVSDPEQLSLGAFYGFFGRAAGLVVGTAPPVVRAAEAPRPGFFARWLSGILTIARSAEFRGFVRRVIDTDPIGTLPRRLWNRSPGFQQSMLRRFGADAAVVYRPAPGGGDERLVYDGEPGLVSIEKARRELGFEPSVPRDRALTLTLEWARHARLLPK